MTRDYTDYMNMTPTELAALAAEVAAGNAIILALAHQLEALDQMVDDLTIERDDAELRAESWRAKARAAVRK